MMILVLVYAWQRCEPRKSYIFLWLIDPDISPSSRTFVEILSVIVKCSLKLNLRYLIESQSLHVFHVGTSGSRLSRFHRHRNTGSILDWSTTSSWLLSLIWWEIGSAWKFVLLVFWSQDILLFLNEFALNIAAFSLNGLNWSLRGVQFNSILDALMICSFNGETLAFSFLSYVW